jgi:two-component system sensor histidine kinase EvgS
VTQQRESLSIASVRIGFFALLLSVIVLSLVGSLVAADRALSTAEQRAVKLDAHELALVIERDLRLRRDSFARGLVTAQDVVDAVADTRPPDSWLVIRLQVRLPAGQMWVEVGHPVAGGKLRTTLWLLSVIAVAGLLIGLARERRQTIHLAARTAELERLYAEVDRSNRMKSEFLANVSHELRTPLNAVVGFVEMLREGVYGELSPRQALPVDRIAASATHLRQLVDRLLDIAKIASGRLEVHLEPLVLRPFVLDVAAEMESLVSERGLALSLFVSPSLPRIRTDQQHLRQILINLIGNAVKYTQRGGIQVHASLAVDGTRPGTSDFGLEAGPPPDARKPWIALQVCDTGVGISSGDVERIFDEFEQVNAGARTDSARRGTGLGLAISRRLARLLGGELTVVSDVGRGSTFTVWLPLEPTEAKVA